MTRKILKKPLIIAFGSQVSGRISHNSDFDFAVLADKPLDLAKSAKITTQLAKKMNLNEDKIDLVDLNRVSPILMQEVASKGKLIDGEDSDFTRFKVRAWKIFQDTAKFRRLREHMIIKNV